MIERLYHRSEIGEILELGQAAVDPGRDVLALPIHWAEPGGFGVGYVVFRRERPAGFVTGDPAALRFRWSDGHSRPA